MTQQRVTRARSWRQIIAEDKRLRGLAESATAALAKFRYEQTIEAGVSAREYARQVGISYSLVTRYAKAHELVSTSGAHLDIDTALTRASVSADKAAVVEAVAAVRGVKPTTMLKHHTAEVKRVQEIARDRAERHGTSVAEEAVVAAEYTRKLDRANANTKAARQQLAANRTFETDNALHAASVQLQKALDASHGVNFTDEQRALIGEALQKVKAVVRLLDLRFLDMAEVDWDGEMVKLAEGA